MDEKEVREAIELLEICVAGYNDVIRRNPDDEELLLKAIEKKNQLETAIEALEKQLPKKPLEIKNSPIPSEKMYYCPICSGRFVNRGVIGYCYHCGQLLDWSEQS